MFLGVLRFRDQPGCAGPVERVGLFWVLLFETGGWHAFTQPLSACTMFDGLAVDYLQNN
jgi:hypothetical protein